MSYPSGIIRGNLAADPDLKYTATGKAVAEFTVIENPRIRDESGNWVNGDPVPHRVVTWEKLAENVAGSLVRGDNVVVSGKVRSEAFVGRDAEPRVAHKITADVVAADLRWNEVSIDRAPREERKLEVASQALKPSPVRPIVTSVASTPEWPPVTPPGPGPIPA